MAGLGAADRPLTGREQVGTLTLTFYFENYATYCVQEVTVKTTRIGVQCVGVWGGGSWRKALGLGAIVHVSDG